MKSRNGFVSNSSSSSFVIGKNFMTDKQIEKLRNSLDEINEQFETYVSETEYYFQGGVSNHEELLGNLMTEMNLEKFCSWDC